MMLDFPTSILHIIFEILYYNLLFNFYFINLYMSAYYKQKFITDYWAKLHFCSTASYPIAYKYSPKGSKIAHKMAPVQTKHALKN